MAEKIHQLQLRDDAGDTARDLAWKLLEERQRGEGKTTHPVRLLANWFQNDGESHQNKTWVSGGLCSILYIYFVDVGFDTENSSFFHTTHQSRRSLALPAISPAASAPALAAPLGDPASAKAARGTEALLWGGEKTSDSEKRLASCLDKFGCCFIGGKLVSFLAPGKNVWFL